MPASSMSRTAVFTASSNISSRSPEPKSPASDALTDANHQPGLPCEPMTDVGSRGNVSLTPISSRGGLGVLCCGAPMFNDHVADDPCDRSILPRVVRCAGEDD